MSSRIENISRDFLTGFLPDVAFQINLSERDRGRIEEIKNLLNSQPDLSYIVYFNHISFNDPMFAAHIIQKFDPKYSRHLIAPASHFHTSPENPRNRKFIFMINLAKKTGFEIIRVIQAYQVNNPEYGYTRDQAQSTYKAWLKRLKELRMSDTPIGCLISPEGTRSSDGVLGVAESGILATGKFITPVIYIPLGISYIDEFKREKFNLGKRIHLAIGETIIQQSPADQPNLNDVMTKLALTLPEDMRGQW
ncbi:MAG: hypothetical protein UV71_C0013G0010 [Microgenomates group bacterium GW2011_GWC1_43_13]|nr:MAG: hypothetical protein UV71_C0013G0010 [Microgenomates group bacterium GW2011_GWC1_43_13]OGM76521.1 MAG: hypothetical protein A2208_00845 [Candidatus Woesebacteria bacterium RIFOXYA1_FULL_43_16]OGM82603.1 MAG: hypothetical protein A2394_02805 [Candidatus Woesebacteria bacterium RIFOXYB1_FULL_42_36]